ncbi:MAG: hypothetical protein E6J90_18815 [Deltaproteobacteria bacterium]|nr:MAG: hypothetical protein E6J90_18815 [Deltaproteobacteria bacterium]TMQ21764.1 MAG: hypothetical protein E6J91_02205 [Deltaproteobacteria bacterium]
MVRGALVALALLGLWRPAAADPNDLVMSRLATRITDDTGRVLSVVGENLEFRALASQLGVVLAPHLLSPADTLGFGGFQFDLDVSQTSIDSIQPYWRVLAGSRDPTGTNRLAHGAGVLRTIGVFAHKGLWFPLPSFEVGAGAVHLIDSKTWAAQLYGKLGVHEGYHDLPVPSIAVRGAVSRMMNQRELDLTVASLDITVSKHFGIAGTWRLDPFAGWDVLVIIPRSQVIEATPDVDPLHMGDEMDATNNFVFRDQAAITRQRILLGAKLQFSIVQLTVEAQLAFAGSSVDDRPDTTAACQPSSTTTSCDAKDTAASQATLSVSAGFDF